MLRHNGHLPAGVRVATIHNEAADIRDGVKGDKGIITVQYEDSTGASVLPPTRFFCKFNLGKPGGIRLLVDTSECAKCEVLFYQHLAHRLPAPVRAPQVFFADYSELSGEFVLISEAVEFGKGDILPLKHRVRDAALLDEQKAFAVCGGTLNASFWATPAAAAASDGDMALLPRFDKTHRRMWIVAQLIAKLGGLHHTVNRTLKGRAGVNDRFMTWRPPAELVGLEAELIRDMPAILTSLCDPSTGLVAYGHNDMTTDNVFFTRAIQDSTFGLRSSLPNLPDFGLFDWQQSCYNNVGQEWAWNWHWLEPQFLETHEDALIETLLATYAQHGRQVAKQTFLDAYVLGTIQMYVWGGGGLQLLMGDLHRKGVLETLEPNDPRCRGAGTLDKALREKLVGAEMTRRTFTNVCAIMRRHDFVGAWRRWQEQHRVP